MTMTQYVLAGLGVLVLGLAGFALWAFRSPERVAPSGPALVGTRLLMVGRVADAALADSNTDAKTERERSELPIRVWYPASAVSKERLTTMDGRTSQAFGELYGFPSSGKDGAPSDSWIDAALLRDGAPHPVVVFSHGAFSDAGQNLSTMEELASHGFVVFSLSHPGESVISLYPDGHARPIDPELANAMKALNAVDAATIADFVEALTALKEETGAAGIAAARRLGDVYARMFAPISIPLPELIQARVTHFERLLAAIEAWNTDDEHPLAGGLATSRLGVFGHSLGGYSALRFALSDERPRGVVSLDVPYFLLEGDADPQMKSPLLSLYAEETRLPGGAVAKTAGANRYLCGEACLDLEVAGAAHMNFSDMNYLPRVLRLFGVLGSIDGARASGLTNDLVVSFFQRHLRGEPQAWLDAPSARYPELTTVASAR